MDTRPCILYVMQARGCHTAETSFCGIGIRGKLTSDILHFSSKYNFVRCYIEDLETLSLYIQEYSPKIIIYNYHTIATAWLSGVPLVQLFPTIIHVFIQYDMTQSLVDQVLPNNTYTYIITDDDTLVGNSHSFIVTRSIPLPLKFLPTCRSTLDGIPRIGYQGFGFVHKGIYRIAEHVRKEFDHAIIRLHMPFSLYVDPHGFLAADRIREVKSILEGTNIKVEATHEFKTDEEIVRWLAENDINCYFYDYLDGAGIASSPDYAIAAKRPIAITKSHQFRHMWDLSPSICIETNSLQSIIANGTQPLAPLFQKYTHTNVIRDYEHVCHTLLTK